MLFNNFYKTEFNFDWKKLESILEKLVLIENQDHLEKGDAITSFKNKTKPYDLPELKEFYNFIEPIYKDLLINKWGYPKENEYFIGNSWVSKYNEGGYIEEHNHTNVVAVICAYLQIPENSSNILFRDPNYESKIKFSVKSDEWLWKEVKSKTNEIIIFEGGCFHKTKPNNSKKPRWVLTTNIMKKNLNKTI
jgi:hypothetical protein